jgi:hypothetical protein
MQILAGRQRPHAGERSRALLKDHHQGILFSEILVEAVLRAILGEPPGTEPLPIASPVVPSRTRADCDVLLRQLLPAMQHMCARWQAIPLGETLLVVWPERARRERRPARRSGA